MFSCGDRPNLRLSFVKMNEKMSNVFHGIFNLYSQEWTGWLFERFTVELGPHAYKDDIESQEKFFIAMYHVDTFEYNKQKAIDYLTKGTGNVRIIIANSALSCCVNCKDVPYVLSILPANWTCWKVR